MVVVPSTNMVSVRKLYNSPGPAYRKNLGSGPPASRGSPEASTVLVSTHPFVRLFTFLCFTVTLPPVNVPCQNWPPGTNVSSLNWRFASHDSVQCSAPMALVNELSAVPLTVTEPSQ